MENRLPGVFHSQSGTGPAMSTDILIREAALADIPEILLQRRAMFEDMGVGDAASLAPMLAATEKYLRQAMPQSAFHAWFAVGSEGRTMGGCAAATSWWPPHPWDSQSRRAYILNLYVYPEHRRQGVARRLMQTTLDWCKAEGFGTVSLHASEHGRSLYESFGFRQTNEMRLTLK
jgi:GNAT superfamily N-acetyltransferase